MVILKNFIKDDAVELQRIRHKDMSVEQIQNLIDEWNRKSVNNRYFEMFAVWFDDNIVGSISLYQHSAGVVSIGPEIFEGRRQKGFGKEAMMAACNVAREKGYKIVSQQIRTNNAASIALHASLGFETNGATYINAKGNEVAIWLKSLL